MPKIRTSDWASAEKAVQSLAPTCHTLVPDAIADAARLHGYDVQFIRFRANWELLSDSEILRRILPADIPPTEQVIAITEASFTKAGPFEFPMSELDEFVRYHRATFGECVVNGDLVIVLLQLRTIVLFHHEGFFARIEGK